MAAELEGYGGTRGSLLYVPARGLPAPLVRKLLRARLAEAR